MGNIIYVPMCISAGVGPGECPDYAYCLERKQPMCGGHSAMLREEVSETPEGRRWLARGSGE